MRTKLGRRRRRLRIKYSHGAIGRRSQLDISIWHLGSVLTDGLTTVFGRGYPVISVCIEDMAIAWSLPLAGPWLLGQMLLLLFATRNCMLCFWMCNQRLVSSVCSCRMYKHA